MNLLECPVFNVSVEEYKHTFKKLIQIKILNLLYYLYGTCNLTEIGRYNWYKKALVNYLFIYLFYNMEYTQDKPFKYSLFYNNEWQCKCNKYMLLIGGGTFFGKWDQRTSRNINVNNSGYRVVGFILCM